jgi:tetratricopeptide (TPR) repeat protein
MKKIALLILSLFVGIALVDAAESPKMKEANEQYTKENFAVADSLYEDILRTDGESVALYYNLGNAKYKQGLIGPAILNYERALLLDPTNEDVLFNLELAKSHTTDKIDPVEKLLITKWNETIQKWFSSNTWAVISIVLFILFIGLLGCFLFARFSWLKKTFFFSGIIVIDLCFVAMTYAKKQKESVINHEYAIVYAATVTGKSSPDTGGTDLFILHEGTKVKIKNQLNDWMEIQLEDGHVGWVPTKSVEII